MKFDYRLMINGERVHLVDHDVRLTYGRPGRAAFVVKSPVELSGLVHFSISNGGDYLGQFYGYIQRSTRHSADSQAIFCREKSAALTARVPIALRNCTLADVLAAIKQKTQLAFVVPNAAYVDTPVPAFINTGPGTSALHLIGDVFAIPDYLWQQRRDGKIYVGSWRDSHWAQTPVELPHDLSDEVRAAGSATLLPIPGLRPGFLLNGKRLQEVNLKNSKMGVVWKTN